MQHTKDPHILRLSQVIPYWVLARAIFYLYYLFTTLVLIFDGRFMIGACIMSIINIFLSILVGVLTMMLFRQMVIRDSTFFLFLVLIPITLYAIFDVLNIFGVAGLSAIDIFKKGKVFSQIMGGIAISL